MHDRGFHHEPGHGSMCPISAAYSAMVPSLENLPAPAPRYRADPEAAGALGRPCRANVSRKSSRPRPTLDNDVMLITSCAQVAFWCGGVQRIGPRDSMVRRSRRSLGARRPGLVPGLPVSRREAAAPRRPTFGFMMTWTGIRESSRPIRPLWVKAARNWPLRSRSSSRGAMPPARYRPPVARIASARLPA
jgi:hypothetical protein